MSFLDSVDTLGRLNRMDSSDSWSPADPFNFAIATVADIGTSLWNSITFGQANVSTSAVLASLGAEGALATYERNREAVELLSLVGGALIPGFAAIRLTKAIREGNKAFYAFSSQRKAEDVQKMQFLISEGKKGTAEYRKLRNSSLIRAQASNMADVVASEVAVMGAMNAHPLMEYYFEDPVKNFGISMLIGGGITAPISAIGSRTTFRAAEAAVDKRAITAIKDAAALYDMPFADTSSILVSLDQAAKNIRALGELPTTNVYTQQLANDMATSIEANAGRIASSKIVQDLPAESKRHLQQLMTTPEFLGVDNVKFYQPPKGGFLAKAKAALVPRTSRPEFKITSFDPDGTKVETLQAAHYFSPEHKSFVPVDWAEQLASAADVYSAKAIHELTLKMTSKELAKQVSPDMMSTHRLEAEYLARISFYERQSTTDLANTQIIGSDLPAINGWVRGIESRQAKLQEVIAKNSNGTPEGSKLVQEALDELQELSAAKITVVDGDLQRVFKIEELAALPTASTGAPLGSNVRASHFDELRDLFDISRPKVNINGNETKTFPALVGWTDASGKAVPASLSDIGDLVWELGLRKGSFESSGAGLHKDIVATLKDPSALAKLNRAFPAGSSADTLSPTAKAALIMMIAGDEPSKITMRAGLESARTFRKGLPSSTAWHDEWTEILDHPLSKIHRRELAKHIASEDGSVYLYRGLSNAPSGQSAMASYSYKKSVGEGFAGHGGINTVNKIHVDDIVGFLYHGEHEFLVASSTRKDLSGNISDFVGGTGASQTKQKATFEMPKKVELDFDGAKEFLKNETLASLKKTVSDGMPVEVAALRHNMTSDQAMSALSIDPVELPVRWNSSEQLAEALSHERRIVEAVAQTRHHLGDAGAILDKQRKAIEEGVELSTDMRQALNAGDNLAAKTVKGKLNVLDKLYGQIHQEWVGLSMATSKSGLARSLYKHVMDGAEYSLLREHLGEVSNAIGGNPLFQSADFVTRNMEQIGRIVTSRGDKRVQAVNAAIKELGEPLSHGFRSIEKDAVARTEFAMLDKFRQQSKGPLYWDSKKGRFYTTLAKEGEEIDSHVGPATQNPKVLAIMDSIVGFSDELRELRLTHSRLSNGVRPQDIGVWVPSQKLLGKEMVYIQDLDTKQIKLLIADSTEDMAELRNSYKLEPNERIISRSNAELENLAMLEDGRIDKITLADVERTKKGITSAVEDISTQRLEDIMKGYTAQLNRLATGLMEEAMHDVVTKLDYLSAINQRAWTDTGKTGWRKAVSQLDNKDTAGDIKSYLLGKNPAQRSEFIRSINNTTDTVISWASSQAQAAWKMVKPGRLGDPLAYDKYNEALKSAGIPNPFEAFDSANRANIFAMARNAGYSADPQRIVNAMNALASTTALKFMEIAQPLVNILSLPILMSSSMSRMTDTAKMGAGSFFENSQMAIMMSGVRRSMSNQPTNKRLFDMAIKEGLLTATVSEADEALRLTRFHSDKGALSKLERAIESSFVGMMSKPSVWADEQVRRVAFGTAVDLAFRNYGPTVSDRQILVFARDFMKQAIGNYSAHQRPAMFQGSFGSAMGLFQTYMLTYAQNTYSHIEKGDFKGLAKMMFAQAGIFGTASLPGWNQVSQVIGANFSDEHFDFNTSLYKAMPDTLASTMVYGLPSNLLGALHTRGDVSPRIPSGFHEFVGPSMLAQYADTVINVAKGAMRFDRNAGTAMLEALSVQSASRPIARIAELANGYSTTQAGIMVAGEEEVWSFQGVLSRILSTRTLAEAKAREVMHLNTVYGQEDRGVRQALMKSLRQDLRTNRLSSEKLDYYATEYLRTGSPQGFRAAVNEAVLANENRGIIDLSHKLKDSPLSLILDDMDF